MQSYIEATCAGYDVFVFQDPRPLEANYTYATLRLALGRCTAPCLTPLHIRRLGSDGSPDPPIRKTSGHPPNPPTHKDERDFYKYYLDYKQPPRVLQLQHWISQLPPTNESDGNGLDMLDVPDSSLGGVARALECFVHSHQRQDASSPSELKSSFERATPGQRALLWLLRSGAVSEIAYLSHPTFLKAITHCLVAENGLRYLLQWIMVKDNPLAPGGVAHGRENSFWRGRLLLNTMEAQAYWTENVMMLEDSVDTWLLMLRQATVQHKYISPLMSANWVTRLLTTRSLGGPFLSSAKFEEYLRAHGS